MNISLLEKNDFEKLFAIMQEAFPPEEYRPKEKQLSILDDPDYSVTVMKEQENIYAFIAVWKLCGFAFAEHLAVTKALRGKGVGSLFLSEYLRSRSRGLAKCTVYRRRRWSGSTTAGASMATSRLPTGAR